MLFIGVVAICILCLITSASAQNINQLFSFPCPTHQFGSCPEGYSPNTLIQASDGNFYGAAQYTTEGFSVSHGGTLFKITPAGQFTLLFTFAKDSKGNYTNGDNPASGLLEANDGFIYGTTFEGGASNEGVLFRISKNGSGFSVLHNFCSSANCADGSAPVSLILGRDGNLYGTTFSGGSSNANCFPIGGCGTIFRFKPTSKTLTTLFVLDGSSNIGAQPFGLTQDANGDFFGVDGPDVFKLTVAGEFTVIESFPRVDGFLPTSANSALMQAGNGKLYGSLTTYSLNQVQFYQVGTNGSGFQEFPSIGTLSEDFEIGSIVEASDGNLWTAFNETSSGNGSVIAFSSVDGSIVHNFSFGGPNGSVPEAGVIQGADGRIYGTTVGGGTVDKGQAPSGTVWNLDAGLAPPSGTIASFSPRSGGVGSTVMIRGNHLIGATSVSFNGVSASFKVLNREFISTVVPNGATSGPITVTNAGGTTASSKSFVVQ
jgi:uncharacterized repeat protein (TIGR03803 family)